MLCDGEANNAGHGACQEDRKIPRRQSHTAISVSWDRQERRTLTQSVTMKQQIVSLSSAKSELYAAEAASGKGLGENVRAESTLERPNKCAVNRRGLDKAKHVDIQNLGYWRLPSRASLSRRRSASRLDDGAAAETEKLTTDELHGLRVHED